MNSKADLADDGNALASDDDEDSGQDTEEENSDEFIVFGSPSSANVAGSAGDQGTTEKMMPKSDVVNPRNAASSGHNPLRLDVDLASRAFAGGGGQFEDSISLGSRSAGVGDLHNGPSFMRGGRRGLCMWL